MEQGCLLVGKGFDSFNPLGPAAIETDLDPGDVPILARVNGDERQNFNTSDLTLLRRPVRVVSEFGDDTAAGRFDHDKDAIGCRPDPAARAGSRPPDVVEIDVPGVGVARNEVVQE